MPTTQALTTYTPEQTAFLERQRAQNAQTFTPRIREIKLAPANKDIPNVEKGHYYIQDYDSDLKEKTYQSIGKNPQIVILKRAATYSYYLKNKDTERLVAWTNDIQGYSTADQVCLFKNDGEKSFIEFKGNYPAFKKYMEENYTIKNPITKTAQKLLKFKTVLYVLYSGDVYRMFVSNPGVAGIAEGSMTADFKKPQLLSLTHYSDQVAATSIDKRDVFLFAGTCELDSKFFKGETMDFYIMQFKFLTEKPNIPYVIDICMKLENTMDMLQREEIQRMSVPEKQKADIIEAEIAPPVGRDHFFDTL